MWPLGIFLLFATAAPPQQSAPSQFQLHPIHPALQTEQVHRGIGPVQLEPGQRYGCYAIRSYFFHRQDGQAPVLTGMTTCTPANLLRQRQASPAPRVMFVPVGVQGEQQK
jgi:hypothetical protein